MPRSLAMTHKIMSAIKSKDTKPEVFFRKALWKWGIRYRKNVKLFGKPDIAIKKYKLVIFIDGDFWHGNNWKIRGLPSLEAELAAYSDFWRKKICGNIERDKKVNEYYESNGWTILRFWTSEIDNNLNECIIKTIETINKLKDNANKFYCHTVSGTLTGKCELFLLLPNRSGQPFCPRNS